MTAEAPFCVVGSHILAAAAGAPVWPSFTRSWRQPLVGLLVRASSWRFRPLAGVVETPVALWWAGMWSTLCLLQMISLLCVCLHVLILLDPFSLQERGVCRPSCICCCARCYVHLKLLWRLGLGARCVCYRCFLRVLICVR